MLTSKTGITIALALMVAGAAPAFAGTSDDEAMVRRLASTEAISSQESQTAPVSVAAKAIAGAYASARRVYPGGRDYHGTDPDAFIRGQLVRDCPTNRV